MINSPFFLHPYINRFHGFPSISKNRRFIAKIQVICYFSNEKKIRIIPAQKGERKKMENLIQQLYAKTALEDLQKKTGKNINTMNLNYNRSIVPEIPQVDFLNTEISLSISIQDSPIPQPTLTALSR